MKSQRGTFIAIIAIAFIVMLILLLLPSYDSAIVSWVNSLRVDWLDSFMFLISFIGSGIAVFVIATLLFLLTKESRKWVFPLWFSFALSTLICFFLKILLLRGRPFEVLGLDSVKEFPFWNASFPSWHAAMAFAALPFISKVFPRINLVWIIFTLIIIFSRMYFAYHFVSDIIAGALIGYLFSILFLKLWGKRRKKK